MEYPRSLLKKKKKKKRNGTLTVDLYKCHSCLSVIKIIERVPSPRRAAQGIYNISRETGRLRYVN